MKNLNSNNSLLRLAKFMRFVMISVCCTLAFLSSMNEVRPFDYNNTPDIVYTFGSIAFIVWLSSLFIYSNLDKFAKKFSANRVESGLKTRLSEIEKRFNVLIVAWALCESGAILGYVASIFSQNVEFSYTASVISVLLFLFKLKPAKLIAGSVQ